MAVKFKSNTKKVLEGINSDIIKASLLSGELLATNIRKETPVVTGNLRRSIEPFGSVLISGNNYKTAALTETVYAPWVEFGGGTRQTKSGTVEVSFVPRAMFRRGADKSRRGITKILENTLKV